MNHETVVAYLDRVGVTTPAVSDAAGLRTLHRAHQLTVPGIGLGDYLIAATALTEGLELATLNIRHYPMFDGLARPFPT